MNLANDGGWEAEFGFKAEKRPAAKSCKDRLLRIEYGCFLKCNLRVRTDNGLPFFLLLEFKRRVAAGPAQIRHERQVIHPGLWGKIRLVPARAI